MPSTSLQDAARKAAGNWERFNCFVWFEKQENPEDWTIVYTSNRDSGPLDRSNDKAIRRGLLLAPAWLIGSYFALWWPATIVLICLLGALLAANVFLLAHEVSGRLWIAQYRQYPYPAGVKMLSRDKYYRAHYDKVPPAPPNHDRGRDVRVHAARLGLGEPLPTGRVRATEFLPDPEWLAPCEPEPASRTHLLQLRQPRAPPCSKPVLPLSRPQARPRPPERAKRDLTP